MFSLYLVWTSGVPTCIFWFSAFALTSEKSLACPSLYIISDQVVADGNGDYPLSFSHQAEQSHLFQPGSSPLSFWMASAVLTSICQYLPCTGGAKLDTAVQVKPHKDTTDGSNHFPWPAGCTLANINTCLGVVSFPCHEGRLLIHVVVFRISKSFSAKLLSVRSPPCLYCCRKLFHARCRTLFFTFLNFVKILQAVKDPLSSSPTFQHVHHSP